jgi:CobQ-like glutamine amidotransferase family enzyme
LEHRVERDQRNALVAFSVPAVDYVGNYTAFQQLRRSIAGDNGSLKRSNVPLPATRAHGMYESRPVPVAGRSGGESALRIAVVHPDLLGTYGDGGNGRVLACRAAWRGWPVELILARSDKPLPTADIYCVGGGEDWPQTEAADLLRGSVLETAVSSGAALFAVCAGFQIVGRSFPDADGKDRDGLGLLDVVTVKNPGKRLVGEVVADPVSASLGSVDLAPFTGFENHSGLTRLGPDVRALGMVRSGVGNGDGLGTEGAVFGKVVGTYLHGPVLARNPALADALLSIATGRIPEQLDDLEEEALRRERLSASGSARSNGARAKGFPALVRAHRT